MNYLINLNKGYAYENQSTRTIICLDGTNSMSSLISGAKATIAKMFERAEVILENNGIK